MSIVHVSIHVRADKVRDFINSTRQNAEESRKEPGVAQFDLLQQVGDETRFVLVEVFRTPEAVAQHKQSAHYDRWRNSVEPLLAEPRTRLVYQNVFPHESRG